MEGRRGRQTGTSSSSQLRRAAIEEGHSTHNRTKPSCEYSFPEGFDVRDPFVDEQHTRESTDEDDADTKYGQAPGHEGDYGIIEVAERYGRADVHENDAVDEQVEDV